MVTLLRRPAPPNLIGRVMSLVMLASIGSFPASVALSGVMVRHIGPPPFFPATGAVLVWSCCWPPRSASPRLRRRGRACRRSRSGGGRQVGSPLGVAVAGRRRSAASACRAAQAGPSAAPARVDRAGRPCGDCSACRRRRSSPDVRAAAAARDHVVDRVGRGTAVRATVERCRVGAARVCGTRLSVRDPDIAASLDHGGHRQRRPTLSGKTSPEVSLCTIFAFSASTSPTARCRQTVVGGSSVMLSSSTLRNATSQLGHPLAAGAPVTSDRTTAEPPTPNCHFAAITVADWR